MPPLLLLYAHDAAEPQRGQAVAPDHVLRPNSGTQEAPRVSGIGVAHDHDVMINEPAQMGNMVPSPAVPAVMNE